MNKQRKAKEQAPEIISVSSHDDWFYIKYKQGRRVWIAREPYSFKLYKKLLPWIGY